MIMSIVRFENVTRTYASGEHELKALDRVSFSLDEGKFVVILGPSGAAKARCSICSAVLTARPKVRSP